MTAASVLVLGDLMRDIVVRLEGPIRHGTDQRAAITSMPGGSAANLAAWLAYDGVPVRLLAAVGHADVETERGRLAALGVGAVLGAHPTLATGVLIALVDAVGERSFLTDRGANDALRATDLPADVLDGVALLHVSGYAFVGAETRATACGLIAEARRRAIPVSFDPGSAGFIGDLGPDAVFRCSAGAILCVANTAEAEALTGVRGPAAQLSQLADRFACAVLKRGAEGAMARHRDGRVWQAAAPEVEVRDTIGAGDAFLAAFLAGHLAHRSVETCLAAAVAQGSFATTLQGGLPPARM